MDRFQVQMQESAGIVLGGLVLGNVQERCLHEGDAQRQAHRDGKKRSHGIYPYITKRRREPAIFAVTRTFLIQVRANLVLDG